MRVGILTFHNAPNPGAYLQAYATTTLLRALGHDPVVLDYRSPRCSAWGVDRFRRRPIRHVASAAVHTLRSRRYERCYKCFQTSPRITEADDLRSLHLDAIAIGSDVLWDYSGGVHHLDNMYFGHGLPVKTLIAWAVSCGTARVLAGVPAVVKEGLPKFTAISVRDVSTATLVKSVLNQDVPILGDPTICLTLDDLPRSRCPDRDSLVVYASPDHISVELRQSLIEFARSRHLRLVGAVSRHGWCDRNYIFLDPFQWVALMRRAEYVFTTTFHGVLFSILLGKQFATQYTKEKRQKLSTLLQRLSLTGRLIENASDLRRVLDTPWEGASSKRELCIMEGELRHFMARALSVNAQSSAPWALTSATSAPVVAGA